MFKFLISLALVAAQSLTWATGSLYVCTSADGATCCIDRGPQFCECCHADADEHASHTGAHEGACCSTANDAASWQPSDCDCQHQLISVSQQVTTTRNLTTVDMPTNVAAHIVIADFNLLSCLTFRNVDSTAIVSGRLSSLNTVVLRC